MIHSSTSNIQKNLSESLHGSLHYVIRAVNKIKRNAFDERLFAHHGLENEEEDYNGLFIHTEVRWLSSRTYLNRFYTLFDSLSKFLENKDN